MADELTKRDEHPDFDFSQLPPDLPKPVPQPGDWAKDEEAIIEALCADFDTVSARQVHRASQADYREQQKGRRAEWPSASTLGRTGPCSSPAGSSGLRRSGSGGSNGERRELGNVCSLD